MSREIDERVVQMRFDSKEFNKNIQESVDNLNSLKKNLNFESSTKGFDDLDKAANKLHIRFGMLDVLAFNVMNRISNAAIDAAHSVSRLVTSLTIDQISPGWDKYAQKTSSVQTIMAATANQFSDTAVQMEVVNAQLDKLNWFTDETSYNFVDMVNNIGKFTSNNIALDQSVTAMQGIANWAAISGANAQEASRAMYNLAQALATGTVKLIDWKSIENANMATTEFKQTVIDIATEMGTLKKVGENVWETLDGKATVSASNFNEALSKGWFTNDVLMAALNKYGAAAEKLNEIYESLGAEVTTSRIVASIDNYTDAIATARAECEELGLDVEATNEKISATTAEMVESVADDWGVSIEQATEWLEYFNDETAQFGLKAFRAAQEAKTFAEAIDSVKDAVSTGWMKSFELIFGNYTEAKELWTNVANTLYDIFATSGDARNELLEGWSELGGRAYFIDTIYAGLAHVMSILASVKAAWNSVFGKVTAEGLKNLTVRLHDFVTNMIMTEVQAQKLVRILRGVFSVFDMIKTVLTRLTRGVFSVVRKILAEFNIDLAEIAATLGDVIYLVSIWFKQNSGIDKIFDAIGDGIVSLIRQIRSFMKAVSEWGPVKAVIEGLRSMFTSEFQGIGGIIKAVGEIWNWLLEQFRSLKFPTSLKDVTNFFKDLGATIISAFEGIGINFDWLEGIFDKFNKSVQRAFGAVDVAINKTGSAIGSALEFINKMLRQIDWSAVLLVAFGITMMAILWKMADAMTAFAKSLQNLTGVGNAAKGAFNAIKDYFGALKKNIAANNLIRIAIAVGILAIALANLAKIEYKQLLAGSAAIIAIAVALGVFNAIIGTLGKFGFNASGLEMMLVSFAALVVSIGAALALMPSDPNILEDRVIALISVFTVLEILFTLVSVIHSKFGGPAQASLSGMLGLVLGIILLINSIKKLGMEEVGSIWAAAIPVAALMGVMAAISRLMVYTRSITEEKDGVKNVFKYGGAFGNIIALVVGMIAMIQVIKQLGKMDVETAKQGIILMIPVMGLLAILFKASQKAGQYASSAGKMVLFLSAGLAILIPVIKAFANIDRETLIKGGGAIALLNLAIIMPLVSVSKNAGKYAGKAGFMILEISAALAVIQLVVKTLGKMDLATLAKGVTATSVLILSLSAAILAMGVGGAVSEQAVKSMTRLTIIVGILGALIVLLTVIDPYGALAVCAGLGVMFVAMGAMFKQMNKVKLPEEKQLILMTVIIAGLGIILSIAAAFVEWKQALATFVGMSAIFVAMGAMFKKLDKIELPDSKKMLYMTAMVAGLATVITLISHIGKEAKWQDILAICVGMSAIILAIGSLGQILKNSATSPALREKLKTLGLFALAMAGLMAILSASIAIVHSAGGDVTQLLILTTAMGELILALGIMGKLLGELTIPSTKSLTGLAIMAGIITGVVSIMAIIIGLVNDGDSKVDFTGLITLVTALGEAMVAIGFAIKLMNKAEITNSATTTLIACAVIMGVLGSLLAIIVGVLQKNNGHMADMITFTTSLGVLLLAMAGAIKIINKSKVTDSAIATLTILTAIVGALAVILYNILKAINDSGGDPNLESAIAFSIAIGVLLAALAVVANIVARVPSGTMRGALEGLALIGIVVLVLGVVALAIAELLDVMPSVDAFETAADIMIQLGRAIGGFVGAIVGGLLEGASSGLVGICQNYSDGVLALMPGIEAICDLPGGALNFVGTFIAILVALTAGQIITALNALPGIGAILAAGAAAVRGPFRDLGKAIYAFYHEIEDIDAEKVTAAANAVVALGAMEKGMTSLEYVIGRLLGFDDLESFGNRLRSLGKSLFIFYETTSDIKYDIVDKATIVTQTLLELENGLSKKEGLLQDIFGGPDTIDAFGVRIRSFGHAMRDFSDYMADVSEANMWTGVTCGQALADLESTLKPYGGMNGFIFGKTDIGAFGDRLRTFGLGLRSFHEKAVDLTVAPFNKVVIITQRLSDLESELNVIGGAKGFLFGNSSFANFGTSLEGFGNKLLLFSTTLSNVNFATLTKAIDYVESLIGLQDIGQAQNDAVLAAIKILDLVKEVFDTNHFDMQSEGRGIIFWIVDGMKKGVNDYAAIVASSAYALAQNFIDTFEAALKIHSPSLVMNEEGHWIVKGLAEGINEDTSAEEAARQKANNVVSAFESEINKLSNDKKTHELEFELWKLTDGKGAGVDEVAERQLALEKEQLENLAKTVSARKVAMEQVAELAGKESEEYKKAVQEFLQANIDMETQRQRIIDTYGSGVGVEEALSKFNSVEEMHNAEFELWKISEGKNASEAEIMQKQKELDLEKLTNLTRTESARNQEMAKLLELYGEESQEYIDAKTAALKASYDRQSFQQAIEETYGSTQALSPQNQAKLWATFLQENEKAYDMLGKSKDELYDAASRYAYGMSYVQKQQRDAYNQAIADNADLFKQLEWGQDRIDEWAREQSGWSGADLVGITAETAKIVESNIGYFSTDIGNTVADEVNSISADVDQIVLDNIDSFSVNLEASLTQATVDAIKSSSAKAGSAAVSGLSDLTSSIEDTLNSSIQQAINNVNDNAIDTGKSWMDIWDDLMTGNSEQLVSDAISKVEDTWLGKGLQTLGIIPKTVKETVTDPIEETIGQTAENSVQSGEDIVVNTAAGMRSNTAMAEMSESGAALSGFVSGVQNTIAKLGWDGGEDYINKYSGAIQTNTSIASVANANNEGIIRPTSNAVNTAADVANAGAQAVVDSYSDTIKLPANIEEINASMQEGVVDPLGVKFKTLNLMAEEAGRGITEGLTSGIEHPKAISSLNGSLTSLANNVNTRLRSSLQERSPSRLTMEIGEYVTEGFAIGIGNKAGMVETASDSLTSITSDSLAYAAEAIDMILNSDEEYQPVITPILDMDELKNQASDIPGLFGGNRTISLSTSKLKVGSIAANNSDTSGQNGSSTTTQTYNFTQNNYSPKSLSRSEIYRQTNNQFSRLKEATKR